MAYYQIEHEDLEYIKKDLDPQLAQEKLDAMDDDFELVEELERMEHAAFFEDIIYPGGRKK